MRILVAPLALLIAFAATASAHFTHDPCTSSRSVVGGGLVHVDSYSGFCRGATVSLPFVVCSDHEEHVVSGVHVLVLEGDGCQTGVLVELPILA